MSRFNTFLGAGALALALVTAPAGAQIVNGDFSVPADPYFGWETLGQVEFFLDPAISPTAGTFAAHLSTGGNAVSPAQLETFLQMPGGGIAALVDTTGSFGPVNGTAIHQDIQVPPGVMSLSFDFNFATNENENDSVHNDTAFWTLTFAHSGERLADTFSTPFIPADHYVRQTGWHTVTVPAPAPGAYRLGFGVVNVEDSGVPSALFVDNVHFIIPEPASVGMLMVAGLFAMRRRR